MLFFLFLNCLNYHNPLEARMLCIEAHKSVGEIRLLFLCGIIVKVNPHTCHNGTFRSIWSLSVHGYMNGVFLLLPCCSSLSVHDINYLLIPKLLKLFLLYQVITKFCSERIAQYAFEYAYLNNRKKVTAVHKANIMKLADGLFLESCREIAAQYPTIEYNEIIVDNCCMQLVSKPEQFDVMVRTLFLFLLCSLMIHFTDQGCFSIC